MSKVENPGKLLIASGTLGRQSLAGKIAITTGTGL